MSDSVQEKELKEVLGKVKDYYLGSLIHSCLTQVQEKGLKEVLGKVKDCHTTWAPSYIVI